MRDQSLFDISLVLWASSAVVGFDFGPLSVVIVAS